jgi:hypothetical protein
LKFGGQGSDKKRRDLLAASCQIPVLSLLLLLKQTNLLDRQRRGGVSKIEAKETNVFIHDAGIIACPVAFVKHEKTKDEFRLEVLTGAGPDP